MKYFELCKVLTPILLVFTINSAPTCESSKTSLKMEITRMKYYVLVPTNDEQIAFLMELRNSNSGLMFLNGIGRVGQPLGILASSLVMDSFQSLFTEKGLQSPKVLMAKIELSGPQIPTPETPVDKEASQSESEPNEPNQETLANLIPIKKVNNNIYSGIFYKITTNALPEGWFTFADRQTEDKEANFLHIDVNPGHLKFSNSDEKLQNDQEWAFGPTEVDEFFTIRNRGQPKSLILIDEIEDSTGYHNVVFATSPSLISKVSLDGALRQSALFQPVESTDYPDAFGLRSRIHPAGSVSWSQFNEGLIRLSTFKDHSKYIPGGDLYNNTLFRFIPPPIELEGTIFHLDLAIDPDHLQKLSQFTKKTVVKKFSVPNNGPLPIKFNVENTLEGEDAVVLSLDPSVKDVFSKIKASISLPRLMHSHFKTELEIDPTNLKSMNEAKVKREIFVTREVEIAPGSVAAIKFFTVGVENAEIPFRALMRVKGQTDRILGDYSGVRKGCVTSELVDETLTKAGFQPLGKGIDEHSLVVMVTGTITGSFVTDTGIKVKAVTLK